MGRSHMCVGRVGEEPRRARGEEPPPEPPAAAEREKGSSRVEEEPHQECGERDVLG
jgi:hypothetical protein